MALAAGQCLDSFFCCLNRGRGVIVSSPVASPVAGWPDSLSSGTAGEVPLSSCGSFVGEESSSGPWGALPPLLTWWPPFELPFLLTQARPDTPGGPQKTLAGPAICFRAPTTINQKGRATLPCSSGGSERLSDFPYVAQPVSGRIGDLGDFRSFGIWVCERASASSSEPTLPLF